MPGTTAKENQLSRLINLANIAEGATIPPTLHGYVRVLPPEAFRLVRIENPATGHYRVTLAWEEVRPYAGKLAGYPISIKNLSQKERDYRQVIIAALSPATFAFQAATGDKVLFTAQTALLNGQRTPLEFCPTIAIVLP